jgi:hypothetical protein
MRVGIRAMTICRNALIVIGCVITLVCGQAKTTGTAFSRDKVAPRGCVYAKMWKPLANLTTPKEFNRIPAKNGSFEEFLFGGLSGADRIFQTSQSDNALAVMPVRSPTISPVAVWLYDRTPSLELLCGFHDNL